MRRWPTAVALLAVLASLANASGEERTWTSARGGKTILGEMVDSEDGKVTIRRRDGKKFTVPINLFVEADQAYIRQALAAEETEAEVRRKALRFYQLIRVADTEDLKEVLVAPAAATVDSNASFFESITPPDRGSSARFKRASLDDTQAVADMSVKIGGRYRNIVLTLLKEDDAWGVAALTYETEDGQKQRMDFVSGQTVDGDIPVDAVVEGGVFGGSPADLQPLAGARPRSEGVPLPNRNPATPGGPPIGRPGVPPPRDSGGIGPLGPPPHAEPPMEVGRPPGNEPPQPRGMERDAGSGEPGREPYDPHADPHAGLPDPHGAPIE